MNDSVTINGSVTIGQVNGHHVGIMPLRRGPGRPRKYPVTVLPTEQKAPAPKKVTRFNPALSPAPIKELAEKINRMMMMAPTYNVRDWRQMREINKQGNYVIPVIEVMKAIENGFLCANPNNRRDNHTVDQKFLNEIERVGFVVTLLTNAFVCYDDKNGHHFMNANHRFIHMYQQYKKNLLDPFTASYCVTLHFVPADIAPDLKRILDCQNKLKKADYARNSDYFGGYSVKKVVRSIEEHIALSNEDRKRFSQAGFSKYLFRIVEGLKRVSTNELSYLGIILDRHNIDDKMTATVTAQHRIDNGLLQTIVSAFGRYKTLKNTILGLEGEDSQKFRNFSKSASFMAMYVIDTISGGNLSKMPIAKLASNYVQFSEDIDRAVLQSNHGSAIEVTAGFQRAMMYLLSA